MKKFNIPYWTNSPFINITVLQAQVYTHMDIYVYIGIYTGTYRYIGTYISIDTHVLICICLNAWITFSIIIIRFLHYTWHVLLLSKEVKKFAQDHRTSKLGSGRARLWISVSLTPKFMFFPHSIQSWALYVISMKAQATWVKIIGRQMKERQTTVNIKLREFMFMINQNTHTKNLFLSQFFFGGGALRTPKIKQYPFWHFRLGPPINKSGGNISSHKNQVSTNTAKVKIEAALYGAQLQWELRAWGRFHHRD